MGSIPGLGDPLEKKTATHASILAWRIPGTEKEAWWVSSMINAWTIVSPKEIH